VSSGADRILYGQDVEEHVENENVGDGCVVGGVVCGGGGGTVVVNTGEGEGNGDGFGLGFDVFVFFGVGEGEGDGLGEGDGDRVGVETSWICCWPAEPDGSDSTCAPMATSSSATPPTFSSGYS
jgi:hypothetical protein